MASGTISTRPQAKDAPVRGRYEEFIQKRLDHTRRQVRLVDVGSNAILLLAATLFFFLLVAIADHWLFPHGLNFFARLLLWGSWIVVAGGFAWRYIAPSLLHPINPVFAAETIEHGRPTLKNSLINFLLLRGHQEDVIPVVYRAMEHRAASDLSQVPVEHAVDHRRLIHLTYVLAVAVALFAMYLALSPKNPLISAARVIWPWTSLPAPTRVHIEDVQPGDAVVFRGDPQTVSAHVSGLRDGEEVTLLIRTADSQIVDDRATMARTGDDDNYACELPFVAGGMQQDTFYRITAGDATTPQYKLDVQNAPTIVVDQVDYHFPAYTGLADRTIKGQGDIKALEGTRVTIHATANMEIKDARIDLGCSGLRRVSMAHKGMQATGVFTLELDPEKPGKARHEQYQIFFTDSEGRNARHEIRYEIDVDPDLKPDVEIVEPKQEDVAVAATGRLRIVVHASDPDFALRHVSLHAEQSGKELPPTILFDRPPPEKAWPKPVDKQYEFHPADFHLKPGDEIKCWAEAEDNKEPHHNCSKSGERTIHIVSQEDAQRAQQNQDQADERQQPAGGKSQQGNNGQGKTEQGENRSGSDSKEGTSKADPSSTNQSGPNGSQDKPQNSQQGGKNDADKSQAGNGGKDPSSSDPNNAQKGEPSQSGADDQGKKPLDQGTQAADAIRDILKHEQEQKQNKSEPNAGEKQSPQNQNGNQPNDNKQDASQQNGNQEGSSQQGSNGGQQGNQPSQSASADKNQQGGNAGDQQSKPNQGDSTGKDASGQQPQSGSPQSSGQNSDNSSQQGAGKTSPQQGANSQQANGGSQPQGMPSADKQSPDGQSSPQNAGSQGKNANSSAGSEKQNGNSGGQPTPDKKQGGSKDGQESQAAGGTQSPDRKQGGGQPGEKSQSGASPSGAEKKPGGSQGSENNSQLAMNGAKPEKSQSPKAGDSQTQGLPGGEKPGAKPKPESGNSSGGQGSQSKPEKKEQKEQNGGGTSSGGQEQPKAGQGEKSDSGGSGKESSKGAKGGSQGDMASGEPRQQDPGRNGDPTAQDSHGAPESQVDRQKGEQKLGDAHEGLTPKPENAQPPGNSPHESKSEGGAKGDKKGGGGAGGGQADKKAGQGTAGSQTAAEHGGSVVNQQGSDATGKKAGQAVRSADNAASPKQEPGKGDGQKQEPANQPPANDSQGSQSQSAQNTSESQDKSSGGQSGAESSQQAGTQGMGLPAGGSPSTAQTAPAPTEGPTQGTPDEADLSFSKKQVDLALSHLKDEMTKQKPQLLDRLGWTQDDAKRFVANIEKLRDAAKQPGDGADKKAYNEFLKNLGLHPHGTRIQGGQTRTDDMRNIRDSGQMQSPAEWADLSHAYTRSAAEEQK